MNGTNFSIALEVSFLGSKDLSSFPLLFLCKSARPDIQTAVAFLCTQVKSPDQDNCKKLAQTMKYLHHTQLMPLTLEASDMNVVKW